MDKKLRKKIGKRVRTARKGIGMSQVDFAPHAGVTRGFLSDIERGARAISVETLVRLCKATGTSPNRMLA